MSALSAEQVIELLTNYTRQTGAYPFRLPYEDIEDALLAYSPVLRKKIKEGLKDVRAGRTIRRLCMRQGARKSALAKRDLRGFPFRETTE